jgi:DNA-binding MarR family transcriptional regulator
MSAITKEAAAAATESKSVSIVVRLLGTQNLVLAALRRGFGEELSLARFDLLMQLLRDDGQTLAALSRRMLVTAGNLTGLVDRAERDGIVERRPDPSDRRLTRVFLTTRGRRLADRAAARHAEIAEEIVAPLAPQDREELRRLLGRLRDALDEHLGGVVEPPPEEPEPVATRDKSGRRAIVRR